LELTQESIDEICQNGSAQEIIYEADGGPFEVKVYDPLNLRAGTYTLRLVDTFDGELTDSIYWTLEGEGISFNSDKFIYSANEQLIPELGISISVQQTDEVYADPLLSNGFIGARLEYTDISKLLQVNPMQIEIQIEYIVPFWKEHGVRFI